MAPKNRYESGQSLVEAILITPLCLILLILFFAFIYESWQMQRVEHLLHEALICENTWGTRACTEEAQRKVNQYARWGTVKIEGTSKEYLAHFFIKEKLLWKTLRIQINRKTI